MLRPLLWGIPTLWAVISMSGWYRNQEVVGVTTRVLGSGGITANGAQPMGRGQHHFCNFPQTIASHSVVGHSWSVVWESSTTCVQFIPWVYFFPVFERSCQATSSVRKSSTVSRLFWRLLFSRRFCPWGFFRRRQHAHEKRGFLFLFISFCFLFSKFFALSLSLSLPGGRCCVRESKPARQRHGLCWLSRNCPWQGNGTW